VAIRRRGEVWQVDVRDGRARRYRETLATFEAARRREADLIQEVRSGRRRRGALTGTTYGEAVALWLEEVLRLRERPTYDYYRAMVSPSTATLGTVQLARLGRREVLEYVGGVQQRTSPVTARKALGAIQTAIRWAVASELVDASPIVSLPLPRVAPQRRADVLTERELLAVLAVPVTWRDRGILLLLAHAGLRRGEVRAFEVSWLHPEDRAVIVPASAQFRPKSKRDRAIPLSPELESWAAEWPEGRWYLLDAGRSVAQIRRLVERCQKAINRKEEKSKDLKGRETSKEKGEKTGEDQRRLTPHLLRHSYASLLARRGASLTDIQAVLGHTDVATTARYIHGLPGHVERIRSIWTPVTTSVTTHGHEAGESGTSGDGGKASKAASMQEKCAN